jgi:hypothetical protein
MALPTNFDTWPGIFPVAEHPKKRAPLTSALIAVDGG